MAKRKAARGAASEAIREVLNSGSTSTAEIKTALTAKGVKASDALIAGVRSRWKKSKGLPMGREKKRRGRRRARVVAISSNGAHTGRRGGLEAALSFCEAVGGFANGRKLMDQIERIKSL